MRPWGSYLHMEGVQMSGMVAPGVAKVCFPQILSQKRLITSLRISVGFDAGNLVDLGV